MTAEQITLIAMTGLESLLLMDRQIRGNSPDYFIKECLTEIVQHSPLQVNTNMTIAEVINEAKKLMPAYDRDSEKVSYLLYCKRLGEKPLSYTAKVSELGIENFDTIVIDRIFPQSEGFSASVRSVKNFADFQEMVLENKFDIQESNSWFIGLTAVLLYTKEDFRLARFVRRHFEEIHQMSGPAINVYVIETRGKGNMYPPSFFWTSIFGDYLYREWSRLKLMNSEPYDKSAAYEIARSLNIYPDELPCLAVFTNSGQIDKIVFPILSKDYPDFFRATFSNLQRVLRKVDSGAIYEMLNSEFPSDGSSEVQEQKTKEFRKRVQQELFDAIRKSMTERKRLKSRTVYNFYRQIVLINKTVNTGGGAYVEGDVNAGRDFIGGDKTEE
jgi:hypothetical protein